MAEPSNVREYIGSRYVPIVADPVTWDSARAYEPLTIVLYQGNSYTSRQFVPIGIDIADSAFWALTGNYNAQIEQYRQEVQGFSADIAANAAAVNALKTIIPDSAYSSSSTVQDAIQANAAAIDDIENAIPISAYSSSSTVQDAIQAASNAAGAAQSDIEDIAELIGEITSNYGFSEHIHGTNGANDTSWLHIALPRKYVDLEPHNLSGSDANPRLLSGNALSYAETHQDAILVTNANYGGLNYPMRFAGVDIPGDVLTRPYLALSSTTDPKWYPIDTSIASIPAIYECVYACDALLVSNGILTQNLDNVVNEPRQVFGWDENYWHVLTTEGRGTMEKGATLQELGEICMALNIANAVNIDGGGSTTTVANTSNGTVKINRSRDFALPFNQLRDTGIGHVYKLKSADVPYSVMDGIVAAYRGTPNGYTGYKNYVLATSSQSINTTLNTVTIPAAQSRNVKNFDQYRFAPGYAYEALAKVPIPAKRYASESIYVKACGDLQFPANAITSNITMSITIARYTGGVRQTASRRRIVVPASANSQRLTFSTDYEFTISKTSNSQENAQDEYALEISITFGECTEANLEGFYLEASFEPPIV